MKVVGTNKHVFSLKHWTETLRFDSYYRIQISFDGEYRKAAEASQKILETLNQDYENFQFQYFTHREYHSIFVTDNDVILGPFFPTLKSMDTPALHLNRSANLPEKYLEYFQDEWDKCSTTN